MADNILFYVEFKLNGKTRWTNIRAANEEAAKRKLYNSFSNATDVMIVKNRYAKDASGYEVVREAENALRELGYNNSVGKYDAVIRAVKSIYGQTLLSSDEPRFKKMIKTEVLKQLKRRGLDSKSCDTLSYSENVKRRNEISKKLEKLSFKLDKTMNVSEKSKLRSEIERLKKEYNKLMKECGFDSKSCDANTFYYKPYDCVLEVDHEFYSGKDGNDKYYACIVKEKGPKAPSSLRKNLSLSEKVYNKYKNNKAKDSKACDVSIFNKGDIFVKGSSKIQITGKTKYDDIEYTINGSKQTASQKGLSHFIESKGYKRTTSDGGTAEVTWQEFDKNDRAVSKRAQFSTIEKRDKFIEKLVEKDNFYRILGTRDADPVNSLISELEAMNFKVINKGQNPDGVPQVFVSYDGKLNENQIRELQDKLTELTGKYGCGTVEFQCCGGDYLNANIEVCTMTTDAKKKGYKLPKHRWQVELVDKSPKGADIPKTLKMYANSEEDLKEEIKTKYPKAEVKKMKQIDADGVKEYRFSIKLGTDLRRVKVNAHSYEEALAKVKEEAKRLKFEGKKVKSKFDGNKLDTRDF